MGAKMKFWLMIMCHVKDTGAFGSRNLHKLMDQNYGSLSWKKSGLKYMVLMKEFKEGMSSFLLET